MKVAVFDTYVTKKDGGVMHFDVLVPKETPPDQVLRFGREYLERVGQKGQPLTAKECQFCHIEEASRAVEQAIQKSGYYILEMEGC